MSLWERGKWYWSDCMLNGTRYRDPLKDRGRGIPVLPKDHPRYKETYEKAIRAEERAKQLVERGESSPTRRKFVRLGLTEASQRYLATHTAELAGSSQREERQLIARLGESFKTVPLVHIGLEEVLAYREWRFSGKGQTRFKRHVGPAIVNMEIGCLHRILKRAKRWQLIADNVRPLKEPTFKGRALTHAEKLFLLKTAQQKPEWERALYAPNLAVRTTMRGCELRGLRWADVNLIDSDLTVRRSKTDAGERKIPLVHEALETVMKLRKRAEMFGPVE